MKRRFQLKFPKKSNKLPVVLEKEDILKMIDATSNLKHKLLLMLMYGSGLRVGEAIKARIEHFDVSRKVFTVKSGKGAKDRYVNLSDRFINNFIAFTKNKLQGYLFESAYNQGHPITSRTASKIVENSLRKAGINKKAHCHTLRTSYATHLIENGTDISYIQKLLGHSDIRTTQSYIRLSNESIRNVKSPLD
jgi:site-specific recombinase XerD